MIDYVLSTEYSEEVKEVQAKNASCGMSLAAGGIAADQHRRPKSKNVRE